MFVGSMGRGEDREERGREGERKKPEEYTTH